jgi:hypothetical protein
VSERRSDRGLGERRFRIGPGWRLEISLAGCEGKKKSDGN